MATGSLDENIAALKRGFSKHISDDKGHAPADDYHPGFMTSDQYKQHMQLFTHRQWVTDVDLLALPAGFYEGNSLLNHPSQPAVKTNWVSEMDITFGIDGRKQILLRDSLSGHMWHITMHTGRDMSTGWSQIMLMDQLWAGSSAMKSSTALSASIKDSAGNYKYTHILVRWHTDLKNQGISVNVPGYDIIINGTNIDDNTSDSTLGITAFEGKLVFVDNAHVRLAYNNSEIIGGTVGGTTSIVAGTSILTINEIIGIK